MTPRSDADRARLVQHVADAIWREYASDAPVPAPPTESMWVRYARAAVARMAELGGDLPNPPRVFRDGEIVPAGVCVLHEDRTIGYLDDTASCDCEDAAECTCSGDALNGNLGPLVEVFLPNYYAAVNGDVLARDTP